MVAVAIATQLFKDSKAMKRLAVLAMFQTYMRPSEVVDLPCLQLGRGDPNGEGHLQDFSFVLHAHELQGTSVTGLRNCNVPLGLKEHRWIAALWVMRAWYTVHAPQALVCSFGYKHRLKPTLHGLQHNAASQDHAAMNRDLDSIQKRGMQKSATSVARYAVPGRINMQFAKIGGRSRKQCVELEKESKRIFADFFVRHIAADD